MIKIILSNKSYKVNHKNFLMKEILLLRYVIDRLLIHSNSIICI